MFGIPFPSAVLLLGAGSAAAACLLTKVAFRDINAPLGNAGRTAGVAAGLLAMALAWAILRAGCQDTPDVLPAAFWRDARVVFHCTLIVFLIAATATDLKDYYITDSVTFSGAVVGLAAATLAGDLQMAHVWVDWNQEIPQLVGPYRPDWLSTHPHLHGLAWSLAGLAVGAGLAGTVRVVARWLLGQEALGFGDVTLMAMIGTYLGWQPTAVAFMIAPLAAVLAALAMSLSGRKNYIPYGPYLSLGALVVLFTWRWIWMFELELNPTSNAADRLSTFAVRRLFGDWLSLGIIAAATIGGLILLLGLSRLYRMIPVERPQRNRPE